MNIKMNLWIITMGAIFLSCNQPAKKSLTENLKSDTVAHMKTSQYEQNKNRWAMLTEPKTPFSCKLTSPELQKRKNTVLAKLKNLIVERIELEDGFTYKFNNTDKTIDMLTDFIKTERQCCDFFNFSMFVSRDRYILMSISGQKGIKEFIKQELDL
jgi:hypothetical protein